MKTTALLLTVGILTLCSCNSKKQESEPERVIATVQKEKSMSLEQTSNDNGGSIVAQFDTAKKKIIKDGSLTIKTNDLSLSKKHIDGLLKKLNGYYETENLDNGSNATNYTLKIRIPAVNFEPFISSIEQGKEDVENKNIQVRDVTAEYIDTESRLVNKRAYIKRYKELLSKASTIKDILSIEEEIRVLQEEVDSKEGVLNFLNDQIAFSTLNIHLYKEKEYVYKAQQEDSFWERLKKAVNKGWRTLIGLALGIISLWPLLLILFVSILLIRRFRKKRKSEKATR